MPFVDNGGVRIHYEVEGFGPSIVLHTGAGGDLRIWRDAGYVAGLSGFRVILVDQRGRGKSDRPKEVEKHRLELFIEDVRAVLDATETSSAAFWGYSNGVLVGIGLGAAHPDRVWALVGIGGMRYRDLTEIPRVNPEEEIAKDVAQGGVRAEVDARMKAENDRVPEPIDRNVREGDPLMHALDGVAWLDWRGPKSVFPQLRAPFLMLTGEREDPSHVTEETMSHVPNGRCVRVPGAGHLSAFHRSDLTLPIALPFLREHAQ